MIRREVLIYNTPGHDWVITIFPKTIQYLALDESETGVLSLRRFHSIVLLHKEQVEALIQENTIFLKRAVSIQHEHQRVWRLKIERPEIATSEPTGGPYQEQLRALEVEPYTNLFLDRRLVLSMCTTRILLFSYFTFPRQGGKNFFFLSVLWKFSSTWFPCFSSASYFPYCKCQQRCWVYVLAMKFEVAAHAILREVQNR